MVFAASCGGDDASSGSTREVETLPPTAVVPTQNPNEDTGLEASDVSVESGEFGGNVLVEVSNVGDTQCAGLAVNFDLLTEDGNLVAKIGVIGSPLDPGSMQIVKTRFIGAGVTTAAISAITCDSTSLGDSGGEPTGTQSSGK